jgi:acyl-CoA thioesterase-1
MRPRSNVGSVSGGRSRLYVTPDDALARCTLESPHCHAEWERLLPRPSRRCAVFLVLLAALAASATLRAADAPAVLVVGDSISAGYGLASGEGWVVLLAAKIKADGYPYRVVNASISGDTTAGGRARLPALLKQYQPAIVVVELGANDALRGGNLTATRGNLDAMVSAAQAAGAKALIVGMQLPPNYGAAYVHEFGALFADVAKARKAALVPFVFDGFGDDLSQFQADRMHPTAAAQARILANVWHSLLPLLHRR